eukprot:1118586-Pleurochrysis_carterae.AAC.2
MRVDSRTCKSASCANDERRPTGRLASLGQSNGQGVPRDEKEGDLGPEERLHAHTHAHTHTGFAVLPRRQNATRSHQSRMRRSYDLTTLERRQSPWS